MADIVKKHGISSELAQKMWMQQWQKPENLALARTWRSSMTAAISRPLAGLDGASMPTIEIAQKKAYTALFGVSTQDFFQLYPGRPVAFGRHPHACACSGVGWRVSHQGERRGCRGDRPERSAHGAERRRLRESGSAVVPDVVPTEYKRRDHNDRHPPNRADTVRRG